MVWNSLSEISEWFYQWIVWIGLGFSHLGIFEIQHFVFLGDRGEGENSRVLLGISRTECPRLCHSGAKEW